MFTKMKFLLMSLLHRHLFFMNFIKSVKLILNYIVTVYTNPSWMRHKISALTNHVSIACCYPLNFFRLNQFEVGFPLLVILFVKTYVIHLLGTYVTILCDWFILWQNAFYLYLGRSRMCLILQETVFQDQVLKTCKFVQDSSWRSVVH